MAAYAPLDRFVKLKKSVEDLRNEINHSAEDRLYRKIDDHRRENEKSFKDVYKRFDDVDKRFDRIEDLLEAMQKQLMDAIRSKG